MSDAQETRRIQGKATAAGRKDRKFPKNLYKQDDSVIWHYDFMVGGERFRGTTGTAVEREAKRLVRDMKEAERVRFRTAAIARKASAPRAGSMTLAQAMERLMQDKPLNGASRDHRDHKADVLLRLIGADTPVSRIDDNVASAVFTALRNTHRKGNVASALLSNSYINDHMLVLELALRAAKRAKIKLPDLPEWSLYKLKEKYRVRELTAEEQLLIEEHIREDLRAPLRFLTETALRRTNGVELTWSQVDFIDGIIRFDVKGNKTAEVPITEEIAAILHEQLNERQESSGDAVFTFVNARPDYMAKNGRFYEKGKRYPLKSSLFYRYFTAACRSAGIVDARPHDLRKTTGSQTLRATGNIVAVQKRLHHAKVTTTEEAYSHVTTEDTAKAMRVTSAFMSWKRSLALDARRQRANGGVRIGLLGSAASWGRTHAKGEIPNAAENSIADADGFIGEKRLFAMTSSTPAVSGNPSVFGEPLGETNLINDYKQWLFERDSELEKRIRSEGLTAIDAPKSRHPNAILREFSIAFEDEGPPFSERIDRLLPLLKRQSDEAKRLDLELQEAITGLG